MGLKQLVKQLAFDANYVYVLK